MFLFLLIISIVPIALPVNAFANYVPITLTNNQTKAALDGSVAGCFGGATHSSPCPTVTSSGPVTPSTTD